MTAVFFIRGHLWNQCLGTCIPVGSGRKYHVRFIQISTDEVYGTTYDLERFTEESPVRPNSPYSASKAGADMLVRSYRQTHGLPVNIIRSSNNYGPYQHTEKLIPLMITKAAQDQPLPVYGDGLNVRDWLHVEDHCRAIDLVLHKGVNGEVYNVGGSSERTNLEVVKYILLSQGKPEDLITFLPDRPGHDKRYAVDCTKIKELGWIQRYTTFERGLESTIQWYLGHRDWWKNS